VTAETSRRNAEVIAAMGMSRYLGERWKEINATYIDKQRAVNDITAGFGAVSKILRLMLQSAMLGIGAWLVLQGQATAGIIIAGSILAGRALAPVDLAIAHWKGFASARQSWRRLSKLLDLVPPQGNPMTLPMPTSRLAVEGVSIMAPGTRNLGAGRQFRLEGRRRRHDHRPERGRQIGTRPHFGRGMANRRGTGAP
jgi:ATP-binding cassette, subfamily C, bacterial PrsD